MPSTSVAQQHFFGMLHAHPEMAKAKGIDMTPQQITDFAATSTKGLPQHVGPPKPHHALLRRAGQ